MTRCQNGAVCFAPIVLVAVMSAALPGCSDPGASKPALKRKGGEPINVVCTTGMVADLVRNVGGEHVKVRQLMGPDVDPHLYQASTGDVSALNQADMIFYSGLHLEANLISVFESLGEHKPVYAVTDEVFRWHHEELIPTGKDSYDPHLWFDVSLWKRCLKLVADRLADYDPQNARTYIRNAQASEKKLDKLHHDCKTQLAQIPKQQRVLVTAHDAFSYFGKAYDIEVKGIQGVSTESEAGLKRIENMIDVIVARKIKAVFVETTVSEDNVRQIINGCREEGHDIVQGGELFSDAMGKHGTPEGTYAGMIRHNVDTIVKALR